MKFCIFGVLLFTKLIFKVSFEWEVQHMQFYDAQKLTQNMEVSLNGINFML